jgi:hypothetical protein
MRAGEAGAGMFVFTCNECGESLSVTGCNSAEAAWDWVRREGWRATERRATDWRHVCTQCRHRADKGILDRPIRRSQRGGR